MNKTFLFKNGFFVVAVALLSFSAFSSSEAFWFDTDVNVTQSKESSQKAGGDAYSDSFNRKREMDDSYNRKYSHTIKNSKNVFATGKGDIEFRGGDIQVRDFEGGRANDVSGSSRSGVTGDGNNFGMAGVSTGINMGDNIIYGDNNDHSDRRSDYNNDNRWRK